MSILVGVTLDEIKRLEAKIERLRAALREARIELRHNRVGTAMTILEAALSGKETP